MPHLSLELLLLMLLAFLIGCIFGCLFRTMFGNSGSPAAKPAASRVSEAKAVSADAPRTEPVPNAVAEKKPAPKPEPIVSEPVVSKPAVEKVAAAVSQGKPVRPKGLPGARDGKPDKLQMISGVGPKLEKTLHGLGFFHFDQIAEWTTDQVGWVDDHLRYKGRIERDEWIAQAKLLAEGDMDQFDKLYAPGASAKSAGQSKPSQARAAKKKQ